MTFQFLLAFLHTVDGSKAQAGCNGNLVWRHTPWLGSHTAKGLVRPMRRALQGIDSRTTANMFTDAKCVGEKKINGEDCPVRPLRCALQGLDPRTPASMFTDSLSQACQLTVLAKPLIFPKAKKGNLVLWSLVVEQRLQPWVNFSCLYNFMNGSILVFD
ncbi:hypothetical protein Hanom_Chr05g00399811 [Helianthus anomalus]